MLNFTLIFALAFLISWRLYRHIQGWTRLPPGPMGLPVVGYLPFLDRQAPYRTLSDLVSTYGKVFSLQMGQVICVVLADPELVRKYFSRQEYSGRAPLYLTHGIMEGMGLICAEGELWRRQRKFAAEAMRRLAAVGMEARVVKCVREMIGRLVASSPEGSSSSPDLDGVLSHAIGNMMNEIIFGMSYDEEDPMWKKLQKLRNDGIKELDVAGAVNFLPWLRHLPFYRDTLAWIKRGQRESHEEYARIARERLRLGKKDDSITEAFLDARREMDEEGRAFFSDAQLHHLQADLFGAGTDTTLTTIKWCILYLCKHRHLQDRVYLEIISRTRDRRQVRLDDMEQLALDPVLLEVQRLRPVVPLGVPHGTTCGLHGTTCTGQGTHCGSRLEEWLLPPKCMVVPLHWFINRDPGLWERPQEFCPERFIEQGKCVVPKHFIPFQVGRRRCVGEDLGRSMVFLVTANLVRNFRISLSESCQPYDLEQTPDHGFTLSPKPFAVDVWAR